MGMQLLQMMNIWMMIKVMHLWWRWKWWWRWWWWWWLQPNSRGVNRRHMWREKVRVDWRVVWVGGARPAEKYIVLIVMIIMIMMIIMIIIMIMDCHPCNHHLLSSPSPLYSPIFEMNSCNKSLMTRNIKTTKIITMITIIMMMTQKRPWQTLEM